MKGKVSWEGQNSYAIKIILAAKMAEFTVILQTFECCPACKPEADKRDGLNMNISDFLCQALLKWTSSTDIVDRKMIGQTISSFTHKSNLKLRRSVM